MQAATVPVLIGEVSVPSGTLLIVDPGLGRFWQHDAVPRSPRQSDPELFDLEIVGPDALAAGRAYDRQFDPRYLFDITNPQASQKHFTDFVTAHNLRAELRVLPQRIPHLQRAQLATQIGGGAGVVHYSQLWAVAIQNLPTNRALPIYAVPMPDDSEFAGRWRTIDIIIDSHAAIANSQTITGIMVEYGQLLCCDIYAFGEFRMGQSLDGLGDFVFWGPDAASIAQTFKAPQLNESEYGWINLPLDQIHALAGQVQNHIDVNQLRAGVDYRPHCNLEKLNAQIRTTQNEVGQLTLNNAIACGFSNRWGDGIFDVICDFDPSGNVARIRIDVGNEEKQALMRHLQIRARGAIVTKKILEQGEPIKFAERLEPSNPRDSGWAFSAGTEDNAYMEDAHNFAIISVAAAIKRDPALDAIIGAPIGSIFRRTSDGYIPEQE